MSLAGLSNWIRYASATIQGRASGTFPGPNHEERFRSIRETAYNIPRFSPFYKQKSATSLLIPDRELPARNPLHPLCNQTDSRAKGNPGPSNNP